MTTIRYPTETEPWIWLQENEGEGSADCGCRLAQEDGAKFSFCTMHAAAEEMLETLVKVLGGPRNGHGRFIVPAQVEEDAQTIIRKARGGKQ